MAFQFDSPEKGGGTVLAFRRQDCPDEEQRFKLRGLDREAAYEVTDPDAGTTASRTGAELMDEG
ncbi:MAG: GH36 C-terminal domain-containing protein, partial [candidate division NC10 bacterium]